MATATVVNEAMLRKLYQGPVRLDIRDIRVLKLPADENGDVAKVIKWGKMSFYMRPNLDGVINGVSTRGAYQYRLIVDGKELYLELQDEAREYVSSWHVFYVNGRYNERTHENEPVRDRNGITVIENVPVVYRSVSDANAKMDMVMGNMALYVPNMSGYEFPDAYDAVLVEQAEGMDFSDCLAVARASLNYDLKVEGLELTEEEFQELL